jgi:Holliday junction resolvase RusA-like endonuclease
MKKNWYSWVHIAIGQQAPPEPFERACVRYVRYCGVRRPDRDNLVSGFKWIQDGLVKSGLLQDDKEENIVAYHEWFPAKKADKRILVEFMPILHHPDDSPG